MGYVSEKLGVWCFLRIAIGSLKNRGDIRKLVAGPAFKIPFVSWPTTKVEIVRYMILKLGASTLIIRGTFTHFQTHGPMSHPRSPMAWDQAYISYVCVVYTSKISTLSLSHWIQHFCTASPQLCSVSGGNLIKHIC